MNSIDLLILHGPPGAGKSSVAQAIAEQLRLQDIKHTVIELDDLARIYPLSLLDIMYKNLAAIWPNYIAMGYIKIILPTYLQKGELEIVTAAAPAKHTTVCEVTVALPELRNRIDKRETDEARKQMLLDYIHKYADNRTEDSFVDFKISNHLSVEETATAVIEKLGWLPQ